MIVVQVHETKCGPTAMSSLAASIRLSEKFSGLYSVLYIGGSLPWNEMFGSEVMNLCLQQTKSAVEG